MPRPEFVPDGLRGDAYADRPLPISYGQTISQRYVLVRVVEQSRS
jgi:protein-L-isoaspartate(D-aspartate) O-methyltransferase